MANWQGKSKVGAWGYQFFIWILRHLGLRPAYLVLSAVAVYFWWFAASSRFLYIYFKKRLGFKGWKLHRSVYQTYVYFGQVLLDKVSLMAGFSKNYTYSFDGENFLEEIIDGKQGGILIGAHFGNWEMAGHMLHQRLNAPLHILMLDAEHQKIKDVLEDTLVERKLNIIPIHENMSHIFKIHQVFKKKEIICMHGDRFLGDKNKMAVTFLGEKTFFPSGPFFLASRFDIPCSFVFAVKTSRKHYHFVATPPRIHQGKPEELLQEYLEVFERLIHKYPTQWFNFYDFWGDIEPLK